jgi:hypothetical protein
MSTTFKYIIPALFSGVKRLVTTNILGSGAIIICVVLSAASISFIAGCKAGVNEAVKDSEAVVFDESGDKTGKEAIKAEPSADKPPEVDQKLKEKELIRVQKAESAARESSATKEETLKPSSSSPPPKPLRLAVASKGKEPAKPKPVNIPEIDRVRDAAREIVKNIDTISKIKICHLKTDDEWWVTLYDDTGSIIDLKQYVWDRESESLTPFLVLKRIPKSRLESHLTGQDPDRVCEVFDPPPRPKKNVDQKQKAE